MVRPRRAVVYTHNLAARGGAERVAVAAAQALRDAGYETVVVSHGSIGSVAALGEYFDLDLAGVGYLPMPEPPRAPFGLDDVTRTVDLWQGQRFLQALRPDVFFNCGFRSELKAVAPKSIYYVHFPHDVAPQVGRTLRGAYVGAMRSARRLVTGGDFRDGYDVILANSRFTAGWVRRRWSRDADVLYPPCPQIGVGSAAREKRIVAVGRFQDRDPGRPHKRQDVLIEAFAEMTDLHDAGWQLHLVGSVASASEPARLRDLAADLPVVFHPNATKEELTELYQTSSIYWHAQGFGEDADADPVTQEHFGITTVEAMSAALIPLVYGAAGPREIVQPVSESLLWPSLDELAIATRLWAGLAPAEIDAQRAACRRRAAEFSVEVFRSRLQDLADDFSAAR